MTVLGRDAGLSDGSGGAGAGRVRLIVHEREHGERCGRSGAAH